MSPSAESDPSRSGGINPFSGPEAAPARAGGRRPVPAPPPGRSAAPGATPAGRSSAGRRPDIRPEGGGRPRSATRREAAVRATSPGAARPTAPPRAAGPSRSAGPGAPTDLLPRSGSFPPGHPYGGPGGPRGWGGGPRRDTPGRPAANQGVTEPPAGLGAGRYPAPILPPLAGAAGAGNPWSHGAWQGHNRRPWIVAGVVLAVVAVLGVTGAVLIAHRIGGARDRSLLVQARELSYRVPADWHTSPGGPETSAAGVALDGVATGERYVCGGRGRYRATVGSTFLVRRDGVDGRAEDAVRYFGPMFAATFYGAGATATTSAPAPLTVGSVTGSTSLVTVHPAAAAGCAGLTGRLTVLALPTSRRGAAGGTGVLLLVVQHDDGGGPSSPAPVDESVVSGILGSVRVADEPADPSPAPEAPTGAPADTTGKGSTPGN